MKPANKQTNQLKNPQKNKLELRQNTLGRSSQGLFQKRLEVCVSPCLLAGCVRGQTFMSILKALFLLPIFFLTFAVLCSLATSRAPPMLTCRAHRDTKEIFFLATRGTRKHRESLPLLLFPFSFFGPLVLR